MKSSMLKYGDIIMLYYTDEADNSQLTTNRIRSEKADNQGSGFLSSPG